MNNYIGNIKLRIKSQSIKCENNSTKTHWEIADSFFHN